MRKTSRSVSRAVRYSSMTIAFEVLWITLSLWAVIRLLIDKREPLSTIAWLFFVIVVPIFGAFIFLVFGSQRLIRKAHKRKENIKKRFSHPDFLVRLMKLEEVSWSGIPESDIPILKLARAVSDYEATHGNAISWILSPEESLKEMQTAIDQAQSFIHLEYYIFTSDEVTERLFDSLIAAKKRGIEVRILYDALGSLSLKKIYFRKLAYHKIKIAGFLPFSPVPQRMNFNFRNHRKILIVDGNLAFTGGANIGRDYLGKLTSQQWRDYIVKVTGPACLQLQDVFGQDWQFTTGEDLSDPKYYPAAKKAGDSIVQVLESGPDSDFHSLHQAVFLMINNAREEISLMTPYFIPDGALYTSLIIARLRGVRVRLLLPLKNDSTVVQMASRSFYDDLLKVGIEIHEYQPKILHAKLLTIDHHWVVLGSANMDIRSFRLNFELNLMVWSSELSRRAKEFFEEELQHSKQILLEEFQKRPLAQKLLENACRVFSPIL
jgi:cardiolipin synthase A/B